MERQKHNGGNADEHLAEQPDPLDEPRGSQDELVATVATVAVVGAGVLIFEAALLPGLVLGIATMLVPKYLPAIGAAVNPLVRQTVRGGRALTVTPRNCDRNGIASAKSRLPHCVGSGA